MNEFVCWSKEDFIKEIKWLRGLSTRRMKRLLKSTHENSQLQHEVVTLRDYSDKQADVIKHYVNQIKELRDENQNSNDSRKFYWAEEVK